jgi:hypothetical protein
MAVPAITSIPMRNANINFGNLALTNQYQLFITNGWGKEEKGTTPFVNFLTNSLYGINFNAEFGNTLGLLCSDAVLPTSSYATSEVKDNFMGVTQEFAHTRLYTDIDLTFYIDRDYKVLRFFEGWMDYVSGGGPAQTANGNAYRRFNYPDYYKNSEIYIKKFEKDFAADKKSINYQLINAFPKGITSIPVSYGPAELLKVSVTFNYDRYIAKQEGASNNLTPQQKSDLQTALAQDAIVQAQNNPLYRGPGSFIYDKNGKVIGVSE